MKVKSSMIDEIEYMAGTLTVKFLNGSIYSYQGVQPSDYTKLINAKSIGGYLKKDMKQYQYKKIK